MRKRALFLCPVTAAALVLVSCGGTPPPVETKKQEAEKVEPVGALKAFYQMYASARSWSVDIEGFRVESVMLSAVPSGEGKYPAWRCTFVSQSKRAAKTYSYAVLKAEGLYKGVFAGPEDSYSGPRGQTAPFNIQAMKVDSDAAYATAMKKGAEYVKKHPDLPIMMLVEKVKQFSNPAYRVIWGTSVSTSNYSIYVDASTGDYLKTMR